MSDRKFRPADRGSRGVGLYMSDRRAKCVRPTADLEGRPLNVRPHGKICPANRGPRGSASEKAMSDRFTKTDGYRGEDGRVGALSMGHARTTTREGKRIFLQDARSWTARAFTDHF